MGLHVGVVGAAGAVGGTLLRVLEERRFPLDSLRLLATERSAGRRVRFAGEDLCIEATRPESFRALDICFLAVPGARVSRELAPLALRAGALVIDKGSAFRLDADVPLVVPEVNGEQVRAGPALIASPNCTTVPLVMCLKPLAQAAGLRRVIVCTYQSASGAGRAGADQLRAEAAAALGGGRAAPGVFPRTLAFNAVPHCDAFGEGGYTAEEWKLVRETRKILGMPGLPLNATAVRVPVLVGHSEAVFVQTQRPLSAARARELLAAAPGVLVRDDPQRQEYPTALDAAGTDQVHVGRIRQDLQDECGLNLFIVADNLRKGAATNAAQIAELWMTR